MAFFNKIKWVLGILVIFILILATNLIDRNNFLRVKDSVGSIYKDRLVAKGLIYEMSRDLQEKEIAVIKNDSIFYSNRNGDVNENISKLISSFEETELTIEEREVFADLKLNIEQIINSEKGFFKSDFTSKEILI